MKKIMIASLLFGIIFAGGCATPSVSKIRVQVIPPSVPWQPYPSVEVNATIIK